MSSLKKNVMMIEKNGDDGLMRQIEFLLKCKTSKIDSKI
jgi:hypothetical protein